MESLREYCIYQISTFGRRRAVTRSFADGDAYGAEWVETAFRDAGIGYERSEKAKSQLYIEAQSLFARGVISLPDHPILLRELRLLERRTHRSGKDSVDHGLRGHDDYANAALGCAALAMRGGSKYGYDSSLDWIRGPVENAEEDFLRQRFQRHIHGGYFRSWR
jgi:hypothetical protein